MQIDARTDIKVSNNFDKGSCLTIYREQKVHKLADDTAIPSLVQPKDSI